MHEHDIIEVLLITPQEPCVLREGRKGPGVPNHTAGVGDSKNNKFVLEAINVCILKLQHNRELSHTTEITGETARYSRPIFQHNPFRAIFLCMREDAIILNTHL
jgi:hypothetical protein